MIRKITDHAAVDVILTHLPQLVTDIKALEERWPDFYFGCISGFQIIQVPNDLFLTLMDEHNVNPKSATMQDSDYKDIPAAEISISTEESSLLPHATLHVYTPFTNELFQKLMKKDCFTTNFNFSCDE